MWGAVSNEIFMNSSIIAKLYTMAEIAGQDVSFVGDGKRLPPQPNRLVSNYSPYDKNFMAYNGDLKWKNFGLL